jgi:hypothetical protein
MGITWPEFGAMLVGMVSAVVYLAYEQRRTLLTPRQQMVLHGSQALAIIAALAVIGRGPLLDAGRSTAELVFLILLIMTLGAIAGVSVARFAKPVLSLPSKQPLEFV